MARDQETVDIHHRAGWIEITNADVPAVTFQVLKGEVEIRVGATQGPGDTDRGWIYARSQGERQVGLAELSYTSGARVWARALGGDAMLLIDHA